MEELEKQCVVVPETYAERKGHHEAEIAGLKEALSILSEGSYISLLLLESLCTCFTVTNDHGSHDKNEKMKKKRKEKNGEKRKNK